MSSVTARPQRSTRIASYPSRRHARLTPLAVALLITWLAACATGPSIDKTITLATIFPATGAEAAVGQAMQRAVDLAAQQNAALGKGYTLTVTHVDEAIADPATAAATLAADSCVMGLVGPMDSVTAVALLPSVAQAGLVTISPGATLPGLTQADAAAVEGIPFAQLRPPGKPVAFFRLPETDAVAGQVAADLAVAPASAHGLAAHTVFVVDDGSLSGKALAAAFTPELKAKGGSVAGQQSLAAGTPDSAQAVVTAIIEANPDLVFFAGGIAAGAQLRGTLSLSGAPQLGILTAGPIAGDPAWGAAVGVAAAAAFTTAIVPARDLATLAGAKGFVTAYQAAYPKQDLIAQSALAYDAALDEIAAIKALVASGKPVTRAAVLAVVASAKYVGVTGTLAFDKNGDNATPFGFSLFTNDTAGAWHYQAALGG